MELSGKHILLGITGGIAAYKAAELIRRLRDAGAEVQVVMTAAAQQFITPLKNTNQKMITIFDSRINHTHFMPWRSLGNLKPYHISPTFCKRVNLQSGRHLNQTFNIPCCCQLRINGRR